MSSNISLDAASQDRKARLAQLKSLKRKQPSSTTSEEEQETHIVQDSPSKPGSRSDTPEITATLLSGRNYDPLTRGPKLGFENAPSSVIPTIESQAEALASATKAQAQKDESEDKPLDLFKLQPKKPNWDLKRDLEKKLEILNVRTDNAIARIVRERILKAQKDAQRQAAANRGSHTNGDPAGEAFGMDGTTLVEAMHVREREEEEEERREREDEDSS